MLKRKEKEAPAFTANGLPIDRSIKIEKSQAAKRAEVNRNLVAYSFIAPNFIGFAVFTLVPIVFAFALAFLNWNGNTEMTWAGLDNFIYIFKNEMFLASLKNTFIYTIGTGTVPLTLVVSLFLAIVLNQKIRGRNFFRTVSFFPYVGSLVAITAVWNMLFNPSMGPVNEILMRLGVENPPRWIADNDWAMFTIILFSVWKYMGYYMVIYLAGLQGINSELYEAASIDGVNTWQKFWYVTLPQLKNTTFFILIMLTIQCFKVYDIVYMLAGAGSFFILIMLTIQCFKVYDIVYMLAGAGSGALSEATTVLVYEIYNSAFRYWRLGVASAEALVLFAIVLVVTIIQFRLELCLFRLLPFRFFRCIFLIKLFLPPPFGMVFFICHPPAGSIQIDLVQSLFPAHFHQVIFQVSH